MIHCILSVCTHMGKNPRLRSMLFPRVVLLTIVAMTGLAATPVWAETVVGRFELPPLNVIEYPGEAVYTTTLSTRPVDLIRLKLYIAFPNKDESNKLEIVLTSASGKKFVITEKDRDPAFFEEIGTNRGILIKKNIVLSEKEYPGEWKLKIRPLGDYDPAFGHWDILLYPGDSANPRLVEFIHDPVSVTTTVPETTADNPIGYSKGRYFSVTFSKAVTGFTADDVSWIGPQGSGISKVETDNNKTFLVYYDWPANTEGKATIKIPVGAAKDSSGRPNRASEEVSLFLDGKAPAVTLSSSLAGTSSADKFPMTVKLSEPVKDFDVHDLSVMNGSAANLIDNGDNSYSFDLIPDSDGEVIALLPDDRVKDRAGNSNKMSNRFSIISDRNPPELKKISSTHTGPSKAARIPVSVTFSEEVTGFDEADLAVSGAEIDNFSDRDNPVFIFDILPPNGGTGKAIVKIGKEVAADHANLKNQNGASFSIAYDRSAPEVAITSETRSPTNAAKIPVTVTFTEKVAGFTAEDLDVHDAEVKGFRGSGKVYSFELIPTADGRSTVDIAANAAKDAAGNGSKKAARFAIAHDYTAPGVTISSEESSPTNATTIPVAVRFSEPVTGFATGDLQLTAGATARNFADVGKGVFGFDLTPPKGHNGPLTVDISAAVARDAAGNGNIKAAQFTIDYDRIAPQPAISSTETTPTRAARIPITVAFPEKVTGFAPDDLAYSTGFMLKKFKDIDGMMFSFDLIPPDGETGTLTVDIPAAAAVDLGGNQSRAASFSIDHDRSEANVTLTTREPDPTNSTSILVTAVFTDEVKGFDKSDLIVEGAKVEGFTGTGKNYSFNLTPSGDGDITVEIRNGAATDEFDIPTGEAAYLVTAYDGTAPTADISGPTGVGRVNVNLTEIPIVFSEPVTGFSGEDIQIAGAKLAGISGEGDAYRLRVEPERKDQTITIAIPSAAAMDNAGNGNRQADFLIQHDESAPTVTITSTGDGFSNAARIPVKITFSEEVTDFTADRVEVVGAAVQGFSGSGKDYQLILVPDGDFARRITVDIAEGAARDAAGNANTAAMQLSIDHDHSELGVVMISPRNRVTNAERIPMNVTFSRPVGEFASDNLVIAGARIENFSGEDADYSFDLIPLQDGTITVDIEDGAVSDIYGNSNHAVDTFSINYDGTAPAAKIAVQKNEMATLDRIPVTVSFTEMVTGFQADSMQISGANVESFSGTGRNYSFELVPVANGGGFIHVKIAAGSIRDLAGNDNPTEVELRIETDARAPTVTIATTTAAEGGRRHIPVEVRFSEPVQGFDLADLQVSGARVSLFTGGGAEYSLVLIASGEPVITVNIAEGVARDRAGNLNMAAPQFSYHLDIDRPSVTLNGRADFPGSSYRLAVAFSEPVKGLELRDFSVVNADIAELSGSGQEYSLQVTARKFAHSVRLRENAATDAVGNGNTVSNLFAHRSDGTGPRPQITGLPEAFLSGDVYQVGFDFGEPVAGFGLRDILAVNGKVGDLRGGPQKYRATVKPDGKGNLSVSLRRGAARDRSGEPSLAASALARIESEKLASKAVTGFIKTRARNVIQHQPDLTDLLRPRRRRLDFDAKLNGRRQKFNFVAESQGLYWVKLTSSRTKEKRNGDTDYSHGAFGRRFSLSDNLLGGVMLQLDRSEMVTADGLEIGGDGWLVGPYVVGKHAVHPLYLQGSIFYGQTRNHVSPLGTFTDHFIGDRWLATLGVEGDYPVYHLTVQPKLFVSHVHEAQRAYTDGLSNPVPAQSVSMTEVDLGLKVEGPVWKGNDTWVHMAGISGLWSRQTGTGVATDYFKDERGGRVRISSGLRYDNGKRLAGGIRASVDGVASDIVTYTVGADMALKF